MVRIPSPVNVHLLVRMIVMKANSSRKRLLIIAVFFLALALGDIVFGFLYKPSTVSLTLVSISSIAFLVFALLGFYLSLFRKDVP